ncbi:hypothetical protein AB3K78_09160 [Leucobacter sp. HNU]|uniref:hypothetical protein n=1 Tax=Leucobacter sp. HNU TaxID=3236805 RepID=UPI003A813C81
MSTTIDIYPTKPDLPLVEGTRQRTEELFQQLLDRHGIDSKITVRATTRAPEAKRYKVPITADLHWSPGLAVCFSYYLNGVWDSDSWPSCDARDPEDYVQAGDLEHTDKKFLGRCWFVEEFETVLSDETLRRMEAIEHTFSEYRNFGGPAVASTGYGLVAAAFAEATDGIIISMDCAFDDDHNAEDAATFLEWWGDRQIGFYGSDWFLRSRKQ